MKIQLFGSEIIHHKLIISSSLFKKYTTEKKERKMRIEKKRENYSAKTRDQ